MWRYILTSLLFALISSSHATDEPWSFEHPPPWDQYSGLPALGPLRYPSISDIDSLLATTASTASDPLSFCLTSECEVKKYMAKAMANTQLLLHTRENVEEIQSLSPTNKTLLEMSNFDFNRPTKVLTHGWNMDVISGSYINDFLTGYMSIGDYNLIAFDWSPLASGINYFESSNYVHYIGRVLALFLDLLVEAGASPDDIHLIGHSLGAHVVGVAGNKANSTIGRVTGLDAAGWLFEIPFLIDPVNRLSTTSAKFVDAIHSCGGWSGLGVGFTEQVGHADFYPNKGTPSQPGCGIILIDLKCSHLRSFEFYMESINSTTGFWGVPCDTWDNFEEGLCDGNASVPMGDPTPHTARGIFYLNTANSSLYALGENGGEK